MKEMDLLLLIPRTMMLQKPFLSIGTLGLASYLSSKGYDVKIIDDNTIYKKYKYSELLELINRYNPKIIGISINVLNTCGSYRLLERIRGTFPDKIIIAGGLHTYASEDEIIEYDFDIVFKGESEISLLKFMELITKSGVTVERNLLLREEIIDGLKKIGGILFRTDNGIIDTGAYSIITDLDEFPYLDHELANIDDFIRFKNDYYSVVNLVNFQRGCPYQCIYCKSSFMARKLRNNSAHYMFNQILKLHEKYGINQIDIQDANFPIDRNRMKKFCILMIKSGLSKRIRIWMQTSGAIDLSSEELKKLYDAGIVMICIGVERFDDGLRKYMKKNGKGKKVMSLIKKIHHHGIKTNMNILLNFPIETKKVLERKANYLEMMLPYVDYFSVIYLIPIPGTELYDKDSSYHKWYLKPHIYNKAVSFYDMSYDIGTVGLEFNLFDLPDEMVKELRHFKEKFYKKNVSSLDRSFLFKTAFIANMFLARLSFYVYRGSPRLEKVVFAPLKKIWTIGFKIFKQKFYYKVSAIKGPIMKKG